MKKEQPTTESDTTHGNANQITKPHLHSMKTDEELLTKNPESTEILEIEQIDGTPFTAVRFHNEWHLCMGKYRLSEALETKEQVIEDSKRADWWRIMAIIKIMITEDKNETQNPEVANQTKLNIN